MLTLTEDTVLRVCADLVAIGVEVTGACVRVRIRAHRWSPSHFAVSCGDAPPSTIRQYIIDKPDRSERRTTPSDTRKVPALDVKSET